MLYFWFTGSGSVLLKVLIWYIFGVKPTLDGLCICPSNYIPFEKISIDLKVKGIDLHISYTKNASKDRRFFVNGKEVLSQYNKKADANFVYFKNEELNSKMQIDIM